MSNPVSKLLDPSGAPVELILYKHDLCPFCLRVMGAINRLGLPVPMRDTRQDPEANRELVAIGGKRQVPMLVINGRPLYESSHIIAFLEQLRLADA